MFGIIKGCGCNLSRVEKQNWIAHVCGLCLTLGKHHGQISRLTTNCDAALLSVLCEAQSPEPVQKVSNICPLRRFRRTEVVAVSNPGIQYAASMSVLMAATKIADHIKDGDTWFRYVPGFFAGFPRKWMQAARRTAGALGFRSEFIETQTQRQLELEQQASGDFCFYSQATEKAVGTAFCHTAVIAGYPQNADVLYQMGQMFGRIMYLLDSYRDYVVDVAGNKFNALARCFGKHELRQRTKPLFRQAHAKLKHHFDRLALPTIWRANFWSTS